MSVGSPIVNVRIPPTLLDRIDDFCARSADFRGEPYTRSSFILKAISDYFFHLDRSKKRKKKNSLDTSAQVCEDPPA